MKCCPRHRPNHIRVPTKSAAIHTWYIHNLQTRSAFPCERTSSCLSRPPPIPPPSPSPGRAMQFMRMDIPSASQLSPRRRRRCKQVSSGRPTLKEFWVFRGRRFIVFGVRGEREGGLVALDGEDGCGARSWVETLPTQRDPDEKACSPGLRIKHGLKPIATGSRYSRPIRYCTNYRR